jgi:dUTP pyrophosphatase
VRRIEVQLLCDGAQLPRRAYEHDAAFDLCAVQAATLAPQQRMVVPTGIALGLPDDIAAFTLPRSGLAARHGITIVNAPGLIDPGYRGEIKVILLNTDLERPFEVEIGDRIAQLLFVSLFPVDLVLSAGLDETSRGQRGFGSSGGSAAHDAETTPDSAAGQCQTDDRS